jgi:hypothetical protein
MNIALKYALGVLLPVALSTPALACYTVYNRANQVIYHASAAPVDMRYQLHETLPAVFPDGHMVFSITDVACPPVNVSKATSVTLSAANLPQGSIATRRSRR